MSNPDQLEQDLGETRKSLGTDVDRLSKKVSPSAFVGKRMDKMKGNAGSLKERVMGAAGNAGDSASSAKDAAAAKLSDAAGSAPNVSDKAAGNPIAAGLIAFGVGWLLSSVAPASDAEQKAAKKIEDNAQGVIEPLKQSAQQAASNLQEPLQQSADALKSTATDAADRTVEHAKSAADDVQQPLQQ